MPCLGIVGTIVLDRIHPPPPDAADEDGADGKTAGEGAAPIEAAAPIEDWGGLLYSLEAFEAAREADWSCLPVAKVGADVFDEAVGRVATLDGVHGLEGLRSVPEPNNRVELHYRDRSDRCERLTGGVPGWSWAELAPLVAECDALYVNFVAGWELDLDAARALRRGFGGPLYCDIHSLLFGSDEEGVRVRRPLPDPDAWTACFDFLQGNGAEIGLVSRSEDPVDGVRRLVRRGAGAAFCTLGADGAAWASADGSSGHERLETGAGAHRAVDPTGCGDAWGAACVAALLAGRSVPAAVRRANRFGAATARLRGTAGLSRALRRLAPAGGTAA